MANEPINTKVVINGKTFDTHNMELAAGLDLYNELASLPGDQKKQADIIASIVSTFASVAKIAEDNGLDPTALAQDWISKVANSSVGKQYTAAQERAFNLLNASGLDAKTLARMIPGGNTWLGAGKIAETAGGLIGAGLDGAWNAAPRVWDALSTGGAEAWRKMWGVTQGAANDNARAFGAAVIALRHQATQARHTQPLFNWSLTNDIHSQFGANPWEYSVAGFRWVTEWATQYFPNIAAYALAAFNYLTNWEEKKPTWETLLANARATISESTQKTPANRERFIALADEAMYNKEGSQVRLQLETAETIAGISTKFLAAAATAPDVERFDKDGKLIRRKDGKDTLVSTPGQRLVAPIKAIMGDGSIPEQVVRSTATALTAATVANNFAKGAARGVMTWMPTPPTSPVGQGIANWAEKPVGLLAMKNPGNWSWINFPGKVAVGLGQASGATVTGVGQVALGTLEGASSVVAGTSSVAPNSLRAGSQIFGKGLAYLPALAPVISLVQMTNDIGAEDTKGAVVHGVEAGAETGILLTAFKFGTRGVPWLAPVAYTAGLTNAYVHNDKCGMVGSGTGLGTTLLGGAVGALAGLPAGGIGAVPGFLAGMSIGGVAGVGTSMGADAICRGQSIEEQLMPSLRNVTPIDRKLLDPTEAKLYNATLDALDALAKKGERPTAASAPLKALIAAHAEMLQTGAVADEAKNAKAPNAKELEAIADQKDQALQVLYKNLLSQSPSVLQQVRVELGIAQPTGPAAQPVSPPSKEKPQAQNDVATSAQLASNSIPNEALVASTESIREQVRTASLSPNTLSVLPEKSSIAGIVFGNVSQSVLGSLTADESVVIDPNDPLAIRLAKEQKAKATSALA